MSRQFLMWNKKIIRINKVVIQPDNKLPMSKSVSYTYLNREIFRYWKKYDDVSVIAEKMFVWFWEYKWK